MKYLASTALECIVWFGLSLPIVLGPVFALMTVRLAQQRKNPQFLILGGLFLTLAAGGLLLCPFSNILLSWGIDDWRASRLETRFMGQTGEQYMAAMGIPNNRGSNENGTFLYYSRVSPWFSMWKQERIVCFEDNRLVSIYLDD